MDFELKNIFLNGLVGQTIVSKEPLSFMALNETLP